MNIRRFNVMILAMFMLFSIFGFHNITKAATTNAWIVEGQMPTPKYGQETVEVNGKIYVFGGYKDAPLNTVEEYDPKTKTWTPKANMPTARSAFGLAVVQGKIYIIGGSIGEPYAQSHTTAISKVEVFDPVTNKWETKTNMPTSRAWTKAVSVNNKIYVFGGVNHSSFELNTVEMYDPATDKWVTKSNMLSGLHAVGLAEYNGKIYIIGGGNNNSVKNTTQEYDPQTDTWVLKADMPTARDALETITYKGKIYAIGGITSGSAAISTNVVQVYDPGQNKWETIESLNNSRYGFGVVLLNGTIYVFGGANNTGYETSIEKYNITTQEPESPQGERAILVVTLDTGLEKEFDLSLSEVRNFIDWYEKKAAGIGPASYPIDKHKNNIGPFTNRKDYMIFDKILTYQVNEYTTVQR